VGGDDRKRLATPDLAKRDHSRIFNDRKDILPHLPCHSRESGNPEPAFAEDSKAEKLKGSRDK